MQKFSIVVCGDDLEKAKKIISKNEMIGELLNSKGNNYISKEGKRLNIFDEEHYPYGLYDELLKIKKELTNAGYKTRVFYLNVEDMDEI